MIFVLAGLLLFAGAVRAESDFFREFKKNYTTLDLELLNNAIEQADIKNFVYQKDVATITFEEGKIFLLRYVLDRPTTAIFIGKGRADIAVPSPVERQSLLFATGDSVVSESFEICFIRMADDFDLKVREAAKFTATTLDYKYYTQAMKAQGEFFFRPRIYHSYDNYFQLLRSCYERKDDGYFWMDFNRFIYSFDPNRPEEVLIGYEYEGGDFELTDAVRMQRQDRGVYDNLAVSILPYPTTLLNQDADIRMGGLDGKKLEAAEARIAVQINSDSLRFVNIYLNYNLHEDSIHFEGQPVEYWRRKDFNSIGIILPRYYQAGDTLHFTLWYKGKDFLPALPFVEDPTPTLHTIHFSTPKGYTYLMPDMGGVAGGERYDTFTVETANPYRLFNFQGYAGGYETFDTVAATGGRFTILKSKAVKKSQSCYIPDRDYTTATLGAFDFLSQRLGAPLGAFAVTVFPESSLTMPGLMEVPQIYCYQSGTGGIMYEGARQASRQWFGALLRPASEREAWLRDGVPDYLGLLYVESAVSSDAFYTELFDRRNRLELIKARIGDPPLATGDRVNPEQAMYKGSWIMHMLRSLMLDLETFSDLSFRRFLVELSMVTTSGNFTNADIIAIAEKHYGDKLDWFFDHWLFGRQTPKYNVDYRIEEGADGWYIRGEVGIERVETTFKMPVLMRVERNDGTNEYHREMLAAPNATFSYGPYPAEPKALHFNEFFSVLADAKVNKK
jgi:hypothetical protein